MSNCKAGTTKPQLRCPFHSFQDSHEYGSCRITKGNFKVVARVVDPIAVIRKWRSFVQLQESYLSVEDQTVAPASRKRRRSMTPIRGGAADETTTKLGGAIMKGIDKNVLAHVLKCIGANKFLFVASVNRRFRTVYSSIAFSNGHGNTQRTTNH